VGQPTAHDVGDFVEDVANIERAGHGMEEATQAVDTLAAQRLAVDDGGVLERQAQHVHDTVHQGLV
jgi:hypothetical protein